MDSRTPAPGVAATTAFVLVALLSLVILFDPSGAGHAGFPNLDKVVHISLFAALAGTAGWRFGRRAPVLALVCAYAPVSELVQAFWLPRREGGWPDVVADLLGVGLGWALAGRALRSRRGPVLSGSAGRP